ncbi:MAG: helicase-related protein, partial [Roseiflexaceae bacterium]|nr:helicase-related protein [Roseiflexaceae bacterium]
FRGDAPAERPLPYLVCSPTMELGIDIADLDIVHLRNAPPTPANYAQRSGRAGRQGQPGLILTFCGAYSNHDQYFFHRPVEMAAGIVAPPRLDLTSEALLRAHLHALWLAELRLGLGDSIERVIDTDQKPALPLREEVQEELAKTESLAPHLKMLFRQITQTVQPLPEWLTEAWIDQAIREIPSR